MRGNMEKNQVIFNVEEPERDLEEAVKVLRSNLIYSGEDTHVVVVTSVQPAEGKSTVSFLLAKSFADLKKKTLYIDADLRKSEMAARYGIDARTDGLSEFLTGQRANIVYDTNFPYLNFVSSGKKPPNPTELLSGSRFADFLQVVRKAYDVVIIDTPPVGTVVDASIVGRHADGVLMVVRNDFTKKEALRRARRQILQNGGKILGCVENRVKRYKKGYYGYGKYYGE